MDLFNELVSMFLEDAPLLLQEVENALRAHDPFTLQRQTHALKGAAATIGAIELKDAAHELELASKAGNLEDGLEVFLRLKKSYDTLLTVLQAR